jgi:hypothetical protein
MFTHRMIALAALGLLGISFLLAPVGCSRQEEGTPPAQSEEKPTEEQSQE